MFWCILYHFGAFGTVLLHHKTRCRTAELVQLMQNFVPCWNFSQQSQLIYTIGPETQIFVHFVMLGYIWDRFVTA